MTKMNAVNRRITALRTSPGVKTWSDRLIARVLPAMLAAAATAFARM
jgi:hypothetical protein